MSSPCFHFRQFDVYHDKCAMKVGTDGVLLGAWVKGEPAASILDVGTGTGLISLILAQRTNAKIDAVEIDGEGAEQAIINVAGSRWADRIRIFHADYNLFNPDGKYDLIISNPPYFRNALKAPSSGRRKARHDESLSWEQLIEKSSALLAAKGRLAVIVPYDEASVFEDLCCIYELYACRRCNVSTVEGRKAKRVMFEFSFSKTEVELTNISVETGFHERTPEYIELTGDLYL